MKLEKLELTQLQIPFRSSFKHASAERSVTETVIAVAQTNDAIGYGEGCPRKYVTGETIDSCMHFLSNNLDNILTIGDVQTLKSWVTNNCELIDKNPAAWCAVEMALLDLFGKVQRLSIEALLGLPELAGNFNYTAVLGTSSSETFKAQLSQYLKLGLVDFKVKISGNYEIDRENIQLIALSVPAARIRLDANNLWQDSSEATNYISALDHHFWALEEPLKVGAYSSFKEIAASLKCKIILDESFLRLDQLALCMDEPDLWIPNIRISKMGGVIRSLEIADDLNESGFKFIIGAQVGETSLLTRAALTVANKYRSSLLAQEGAFGTYLLTRDVTDTPLMFGKGGVMPAPIESVGLGVNYNYEIGS